MGKVSLGIWTDKNISLSRSIRSCMERTGTNREKLVAKARISMPTFYKHLRDPDKITLGELRAYIKTLEIPKEDILDALYLDKGAAK